MTKHYPRVNAQLRGKLRMIAREMRQAPTSAEDLLWQRLRGRQPGGHKFHRQYRIDRFIVDFYCAKSALVVEVDGKVHQQQIEEDRERESILTELGFQVIRFTNVEVLEQIDQVLDQILAAINKSQENRQE